MDVNQHIHSNLVETQRLYELVRRRRADLPETFGGCTCSDCKTIGLHWNDWLPDSLKTWLTELGIDWLNPFEVCCAGDLGLENTVILPDFVGVGTANQAFVDFPGVGIHIDSGNHSPGSWLPEGHAFTHETPLYTLSMNMTVGIDLKVQMP